MILLQPPFDDTIKLVRGSESDKKHAFCKLQSSFHNVRELYSSEPILSSDQLEFRDPHRRALVEVANLAQLGSWLVDGSPQALSDADDNFLEVFQCQLSDLPHGMTELYLGIKTQRAIEFLVEGEPDEPGEPSRDVLGDVLTRGLENTLKEQHGEGVLTSADQSFVSSVKTMKETLQGEIEKQSEPGA